MNNTEKNPAVGCALERRVIRDPICGNCENPLSQHYRENVGKEERIYCYTHTNGDLFTNTPPDSWVFNELLERHPDIYDALVAEWKMANGHDV